MTTLAKPIQPDLRKKKINWQKVAVITLFAAVPMFLLILFTYVPFVKMIQFSFYNMSYTKNKGFVGLDNYLRIFTKSEYVDAMLLSLYYMAGAVVQLSLALFFASVLSLEKIRGAGFSSPPCSSRSWSTASPSAISSNTSIRGASCWIPCCRPSAYRWKTCPIGCGTRA